MEKETVSVSPNWYRKVLVFSYLSRMFTLCVCMNVSQGLGGQAAFAAGNYG